MRARVLLASVAAVACGTMAANPARSAPGACTVVGTAATCTGDQSAGIANGKDFAAAITQLTVTRLLKAIAPPSGVVGIRLTGAGASGAAGSGSGGDGRPGSLGPLIALDLDGVVQATGTSGIVLSSQGGAGGDGANNSFIGNGGNGGAGAGADAISVTGSGRTVATNGNPQIGPAALGILSLAQAGGRGGAPSSLGGAGGDGGAGGSSRSPVTLRATGDWSVAATGPASGPALSVVSYGGQGGAGTSGNVANGGRGGDGGCWRSGERRAGEACTCRWWSDG